MPRYSPPASRHRLSSGLAMMLIGTIFLLDSDIGDVEEDIGLVLLTTGALVYVRELKERRKLVNRNGRYGVRGFYKTDRTQEFIDDIINQNTDRVFKMWFRMNRSSFFRLLDLIKGDPVFVSRGNKPQTPPLYQLATYLVRYGAEPGVKVATILQMSEGTVYNHSARVVRALRRLRPLYLSWPTPEERRVNKRHSRAMGFPGAVGVIDGSYLNFMEKPSKDAMSYRSRKKNWALNMQALVDFTGKFISYDLGWPGSTNDITVYKKSHLWTRRDEYLAPDEWIMADIGHPVTPYLIALFSPDECVDADPEVTSIRKRWNKAFSSEHIVVEHAFGRLKARFPFIQCMRGRDIANMCRVVESLLVLHNILLSLGDNADDIDGVDMLAVLRQHHEERPQEAEFHIAQPVTTENMRNVGLERRRQLVEYWRQNGFDV